MLGKVLVYDRGARVVARDFYGVSSVRDVGGVGAVRTLYSGTIVHGEQLLAPGRALTPTSYYGPSSGVGVLLREENRTPTPRRVGVIGLGVGTIAAYGRPGDSYRFYEIDPLDISIAKTWFSFLRESPAHVASSPETGACRWNASPASISTCSSPTHSAATPSRSS